MYITQIKETCLYVQDLRRTEAFYKEKLQFEVIGKSEGRHVFFRAGSSVLLCFNAEATKDEQKLPAHYGVGKMHIAFEVPKGKYEEVKNKIQSQGVSIEHEQQWDEDNHSFYFRDPDGHSLEIVSQGMWE